MTGMGKVRPAEVFGQARLPKYEVLLCLFIIITQPRLIWLKFLKYNIGSP